MKAARPVAAQSTPTVTPVRVFRVEEGQTVELISLSGSYGGLFTHWAKGRSILCRGAECPGEKHRQEKFWKGYAPVWRYEPDTRLLIACVLEISEHTELDMRGVWRRGQLWRLAREVSAGQKHAPCTAELRGLVDQAQIPIAFDVRPVLMHLYHAEQIDLTVANPAPPRIVIPPTPFHDGLKILKNGPDK